MTSRLDRLVLLLDTGSTPAIRSTAAAQLGEIQKQHPDELRNLLQRVAVHLRSNSWDTRTAAGQAIAEIAKNTMPWIPPNSVEDGIVIEPKSLLSFDKFDIQTVLKRGKTLLGSAGKEYDLDLSHLSPEERLKTLKKNIKKDLGLDMDFLDDEFDDLDVIVPAPQVQHVPEEKKIDLSKLSARERNKAKRALKENAKSKSKNQKINHNDSANQRPTADPRASIAPTAVKTETKTDDTETVIVESKQVQGPSPSDPYEWPFEALCENLCIDLFNANWTIRHGAGIGLREILKYHGATAGKIGGKTSVENEELHNAWLQDVCIRLLCVFALDRFSDFVSDSVVTPVRETCSQTLGALVKFLTPDDVLFTMKCINALIIQPPNSNGASSSVWETRHAGLLGLKYLVAVRKDLVAMLLPGIIQSVTLGLSDPDDDVRGVSAATLIPITQELVELAPEWIPQLFIVLWKCLEDTKDDLSASTGSIMDLLAKVISYPQAMESFRSLTFHNPHFTMSNLVPILFSYFRHTISSVRLAVLHTLNMFLQSNLTTEWIESRLLCMIFQNMILEQKKDIITESSKLWTFIMQVLAKDPNEHVIGLFQTWLPTWITHLTNPIGLPYDPARFFIPDRMADAQSAGSLQSSMDLKHNLDAPVFKQDLSLIDLNSLILGRMLSAKSIAQILHMLPIVNLPPTLQMIIQPYIYSGWGIQQQLACVVLEEWSYLGMSPEQSQIVFDLIVPNITPILEAQHPYHYLECLVHLRKLRQESQNFVQFVEQECRLSQESVPHIPPHCEGEGPDGFNLIWAYQICDQFYQTAAPNAPKKSQAALNDRYQRILNLKEAYEASRQEVEIRTHTAIACALIRLAPLPSKLSPIIKAIMNSIKNESNLLLQSRSAKGLSNLVWLNSEQSTKSTAVDKIVKNLSSFLCSDRKQTPTFEEHDLKEGIYALINTQVQVPKTRGRQPNEPPPVQETEEAKMFRLYQRGAELSFEQFCIIAGESVFNRIPKLESLTFDQLRQFHELATQDPSFSFIESRYSMIQELIDSLKLLSTITNYLHTSLYDRIKEAMTWVMTCVRSPFAILRNMAAKCLSTISSVLLSPAMQIFIEFGLPFLGDTTNIYNRQGTVEAIYFIVKQLGSQILPYVIFLVVPILGRMSDVDQHVRLVSTNTFALLINLIPLEAGIPTPDDFPPHLIKQREHERNFISQLLNSNDIQPYEIPVKINAELRSYQREGINWLAFLNKYQLHGILCDDMGLGKTLQSICILASDHFYRKAKFEETQSPDSRHLPSLVVCPPTLTGHWFHEVINYTSSLKPLLYTGVPAERKRLRNMMKSHDVIIMSYDIVRNDIEELGSMDWNYCILDEGHIIKNGKTKITKAVKSIRANHRLILSGTPVQNNVLELWSLFDFLMPGFLGTEKAFNDLYGKPILASKDAKSSSKEQEAGALALEALHKQVLPFLLRRLKEDVLDDLPPKIIQDYYCELSDVQKQMYEDFVKTQNVFKDKKELENDGSEPASNGKTMHIFQALQYIRKLCNHPLLVLSPKHANYNKYLHQIGGEQNIRQINNAPKLAALKQLLNDCGIGAEQESENDPLLTGAVSQHRALIFCQLKSMLDIVENDLLKTHLPSVTYLRLDGSVEANSRHDIVQKFNRDPSIDVLLLTTQVGGLGLNLTGADTVIFVEHDWNPMKDLQAMDRAHRLGQRKVVNVYRLIARGTLEEKIMGLQKFKLNIANSIVNQQNSGLSSMDTDQLLDLFKVPAAEGSTAQKAKQKALDKDGGDSHHGLGAAGKIIENLDQLWDDQQYKEEFDLDQFISNLPESQK